MKENSIQETLSSMDREGTDRHSVGRKTTGKLEDSKTSYLEHHTERQCIE